MNLLAIAALICAGLVYGHPPAPSTGYIPDPAECPAMMTAFPFELATKCCTHASRSNGTAVGKAGRTTEKLYQHPWAALIDYKLKKSGSKKRLCGGTLISGKYVLTAAHCIVGPLTDRGPPTAVRLGEYDWNHEGKDCVPVQGGGEECNNEPVIIAIETTTLHPQYFYSHPSNWNDIGLIRLKETAPYTNFIRPICLNIRRNPMEDPHDDPYYAVGWNSKENIKVVHKVPYVSHEKCQPIYASPRREIPVVLADGQICAGGIKGMDPCKGDGGSALVFENPEGITELVGIYSFGIAPCGQKNIPSVYTNLYPHIDWIKTIIKE